jgi:hypothetical protein
MRKMKSLNIASIILLTIFLCTCTAGLDGQLEYADFLLDKGQFGDAITLLDVLDAQYPGNVGIKSRLGSAHLAHAILNQTSEGSESPGSYLSLLADYLEVDTGSSSRTVFQQFAERSPALTDDGIAELALARKILNEDISDADKGEKEWLQLGFARLIEINAIGVVKTGALSPDNVCNADPTNTNPDGLPDEYTAGNLTADDSAQFDEDVAQVKVDFTNAGLPDLSIITAVEKIASDLAAASSLQNYLDTQFNQGVACL